MYFVCPRFACRTQKIPKMLTFHQGIVGTSRLRWYNPFRHQSTQSAVLHQNDQNARLTKSQNWLKPPQKNNFHVFTSNPRLSEIFVNFDQVWPEVDSWEWPENLILIRPLEWVGTNVIVEMIEFPFQRLLMGQNRN